jgi:hypothetical protein
VIHSTIVEFVTLLILRNLNWISVSFNYFISNGVTGTIESVIFKPHESTFFERTELLLP